MKLPQYVYAIPSRHGQQRLYFWCGRGHKRIRIREPHGTPEFYSRVADLLSKSGGAETKIAPRDAPKPHTLKWLWIQFSGSQEYLKRTSDRTRYVSRLVVESILREPIAPGDDRTFADFPLVDFTSNEVEVLRDRCADRPEAANNRVKRLRAIFRYAVKKKIVMSNPTEAVERLPPNRVGGFPVWLPEHLDTFEAKHAIGTKAHLALGLLQYLGVRRSDVVRLGKQHERGNRIKFRVFKGRNRRPIDLDLVVSDTLRRIIQASPTGHLAYLVTEYGQPFTAAGFGNKFREWCDEAGLPGLSAHGVRKAAATRAAEQGATPHELMAQFGWLTLSQAMLYTETANRAKLATNVGPMLERNKTG